MTMDYFSFGRLQVSITLPVESGELNGDWPDELKLDGEPGDW